MCRILAIVCSALISCGSIAKASIKNPRPITKQVVDIVFGGAANHEIVHTATDANACRLILKDKSYSRTADESDYEQGSSVSLSPEQIRRVRTVLETPDSYQFEFAKGCIPVYGVRLCFQNP